MKAKFIILTPVYNDWKNLNNLLSKINKLFINKVKQKFDLIIVDDSSEEKIIFRKQSFQSIKNLRILKNYDNLGSQRSIAIGLRYIKKIYRNNYQLIVIDSDGQDNPDGILKLIKKFNKTNSCVVAKRGQRRESLWFKTCYEIYCLLIFILSFKKIRFGNFSILRFEDVNNILRNNNLWGAFPPTLSLNLKKISFITIDREKRYSGNSKMNFFGLFYHAMRVFSVLRFNYRGVGNSEGSYSGDEGIGEMTDAACALDWLLLSNTESTKVWVTGFSFGAFIGLNLLMRRPEIEGFIAISPPADKYDFSFFCYTR